LRRNRGAHPRELVERLQAEYPGTYPDGLLRTCQRRLKEWRREAALQLVFGTTPADVINSGTAKERSVTAPIGVSDYPVDLPLRLDDAIASPTTPQGPATATILVEKRQGWQLRAESMRQREHLVEATGTCRVTFSAEAIRLPIQIAALQEHQKNGCIKAF
jgi:hypothetical protein